MVYPAPIEKPHLAQLLPHSGDMCLLDRVLNWDEAAIHCQTLSHHSPENPLRDANCLPVQAGIEYAAQAMAIHGKLCSDDGCKPRIGYLAVLSKVDWYVNRLDNSSAGKKLPLEVYAEKLMASAGGSSYHFRLQQAGELLIEGQALVALQE